MEQRKQGLRDEKKSKERSKISKVGDFYESKVNAIVDILIANGQRTLPPCKRPTEINKVDDSNYCRYHRS